ncbi:MAG: aminomethyl-transferring glycine dehydrogenase [Phycisphaera sp.]|nr:aminomethyl-transferring glycine dehydrogenase [Phycisphaera sp.]
MTATPTQSPTQTAWHLEPSDTFARRHIGPSDADIREMLATLGYGTLDELTDATLPRSIRIDGDMGVGSAMTETQCLAYMKAIASKNKVMRSFIGMGYHGSITPGVIARNILENPGWYTQYTPYQAEISQGRLEAILNFQTMVCDLTALPLANASLLDEATAAAEAMAMAQSIAKGNRTKFLVADDCHPQTIAVVKGRAEARGWEIVVAKTESMMPDDSVFGVLVQYPTTDGHVKDYTSLVSATHTCGGVVIAAADILALALLKPPGEWGADIAVGSTQRFGVPMGFGGPHAAYLACRSEYSRKMPGRLVGVSKDASGNPALRLAVQTREQHIRRDKATSNICTAQVLLAIMASMYAVYHGPDGLRRIAQRVQGWTCVLAAALRGMGLLIDGGEDAVCFDTLRVRLDGAKAERLHKSSVQAGINLRHYPDGSVGVTLDETTTAEDVQVVIDAFASVAGGTQAVSVKQAIDQADASLPEAFARTSAYLTHEVFHRYHAEHEMLRYIKRLESRDSSLCNSMIPLGSCTMKLNATSEMVPVTWPGFADIHPFAPADQTRGYAELFAELERLLAGITHLPGVSLQPNAGSSGEYAGLLVIRAYHHARGDVQRDVCLIPVSAHGTNPASAVMAGFRVVAVECDEQGNIDLDDLKAKAQQHAGQLGALMLTYPSTHGVFEEGVIDVCKLIHAHGGQVYMDGANMNAQVGLTAPGRIGADVCHLNLHKTFCIPHGGGGPGMGPICVAKHLQKFLPGHPVVAPDVATPDSIKPVSAAPYGSPMILPISYAYIKMMGDAGLRKATQVAILNANYMANQLKDQYAVLFRGRHDRVAHEFILDCRSFEKSAGIRVEDMAKRLMDYGFHAPTMSWPEPGTLMIEPTESESRAELDRLCEAMTCIRREIVDIEQARSDREDNALKHAPHTTQMVSGDEWNHPYTRESAAFPVASLRTFKFWPAVARIDNAYGDRHLVCTCPSVESLAT